jgi:hypothetical protein
MQKRHAVEILHKAGHPTTEAARLAGVSVRSVHRIAEEGPVGSTDDGRARVKRRIGRPNIVGNFRKLVTEIPEQRADLPSPEILRRAREAGYQGAQTSLYELAVSLRPKDGGSVCETLISSEPGAESSAVQRSLSDPTAQTCGRPPSARQNGLWTKRRFVPNRILGRRWTQSGCGDSGREPTPAGGELMTGKTDHNTPQGLELPRVQPDALFRHVNLANTRRIDKDVAPRAKAENWPTATSWFSWRPSGKRDGSRRVLSAASGTHTSPS